MKKLIVIILLSILNGFSFSQEIDSLKKIIDSDIPIDKKENAYWLLCEEFNWTEPTVTLQYVNELLKIEAVQKDSVRLMKII